MTPRERVKKIEDECSGVWAESGVTSWEREFLASIKERYSLSEKQESVLAGIEIKVFGEDDDE